MRAFTAGLEVLYRTYLDIFIVGQVGLTLRLRILSVVFCIVLGVISLTHFNPGNRTLEHLRYRKRKIIGHLLVELQIADGLLFLELAD